MAEMGVAAGAPDLDARHRKLVIECLGNDVTVDRLEEARPAGARFILGVAREQRLAATGAAVESRPLLVVVGARERRLRTAETSDAILLGRQFGAPLRRTLLYLAVAVRCCHWFSLLVCADDMFPRQGWRKPARAKIAMLMRRIAHARGARAFGSFSYSGLLTQV